MYHQCPKCDKPWIENEIEFQVCNNCGYEKPDAWKTNLSLSIKLLLIFPLALALGVLWATLMSYLGINLFLVGQAVLITGSIMLGFKKYFMRKK